MQDNTLCPYAVKLVEQIFAIFYALCDGFDSQFHDSRKLNIVKTQWILAFMENNITHEDHIKYGLRELRKQKKLVYIPVLGDFLAWCTELKQNNFLTKDQAYIAAYEIMRNEPREDLSQEQINILEHAIKASDRHFLKHNSRNVTEPVFHRNYEIALRDFINGDLKPIPKAIENKQTDDDGWKSIKAIRCLSQYAHLNSHEKAMPIIKELIKKMGNKFPYDKHTRL